MFLKASAAIAVIGLLMSYFLFTAARVINDLITFETYEKFRYAFRAAYYLGDILNYFPLIIFFMAFYLSLKKDNSIPQHDPSTGRY
jgi:hypothetical protein